MVGWYPGDGNANDISSTANNGTLQGGATFAPGMVAQAFSLNGSDAYVQAPANAAQDPTMAGSQDAWVFFNQLPSAAGHIMEIIGKGANGTDFDLQAETDNKFHFYIAAGNSVTSTTVIQTGVWYHVAGTWDATGLRMYVNGVLENTNGVQNLTRGQSGNPLQIGNQPTFGPRLFNGLIDEAEIFNRALTAAEVQAIYNAGSAGKCKSLPTPSPTPTATFTPTPTATATFTPTPTQAQFVYVTNEGSNNISAYSIDATSGALTPVAGSPFGTDSGPNAVAGNVTGTFAFVANQNYPNGSGSVSVYSIDATSGALTPVTGSPFGDADGEPYGLAVDPTGKFAYVTNLFSNNVSAYTIDATSGALTPVAGSPFATAGGEPEGTAVDPTGKFVYVPNSGANNVSAYTIDATTGALTPVAGSPFATGRLRGY